MSSPDILDCLANLSSDEVFTPPKLANEMLDLLPSSLWRNPNARFCDPFTKSGVFLREIVKRLDAGLSGSMPDKDERIRHILGRQVYGIAITRLTALIARRTLYCNKDAHGSHAAIQRLFRDEGGLVAYSRSSHRWKNGACEICGASEKAWGKKRSADVENYAYPFLHDERIIKMAEELGFDVVIGNPPYQMKDGGGNGSSSAPIYQKFIQQALKLNPRFLVMIIPARWYAGGKGLDEFRDEMIHDRSIKELHDFFDATACFPGVDISGGVCYFLRDREYNGMCRIVTHEGERAEIDRRYLHEDGCEVFIRHKSAVDILRKVRVETAEFFDGLVSSRRPYNLDTSHRGKDHHFAGCLRLQSSAGTSFIKRDEMRDSCGQLDAWKLYISVVYGERGDFPYLVIGKPTVGEPNSCCTDSYLSVGPFKSKRTAENVASYMRTRFFRFLVLIQKNTQIAPRKVYSFVPIQDFSKPWTDAELYKKYGLDEKEISFIESMIRPMEEAR